MESLNRIRKIVLAVAEKLTWLPPALARLCLGVVFVLSGWGKLHNLETVRQFFAQLHIPAPDFTAAFVASIELVCGALVLVGVLTRIAVIPLIITMIVAIVTVKMEDMSGLRDLLRVEEFHYILLSVWLAIAGAGSLSLDQLMARRLERNEKSGSEPRA
jgi:putative oxidoreductase